jgi:TRAP-type C4-dicarboxylate transport system permease small subunit
MRLVDLIWLISPTFRHTTPDEAGVAHGPAFPMHWMDLAIPIGLFGLWLFLFVRQLRAQALFPVNDPYFKESFAHEAAH